MFKVIFGLAPFRRGDGSPQGAAPESRGVLVIAIGSAAYLLWLLLDRSSPELRTLVSDLVGPAAALVGFVWSLRGVRRPKNVEGRAGDDWRGA
jgi:hypothetical protein